MFVVGHEVELHTILDLFNAIGALVSLQGHTLEDAVSRTLQWVGAKRRVPLISLVAIVGRIRAMQPAPICIECHLEVLVGALPRRSALGQAHKGILLSLRCSGLLS